VNENRSNKNKMIGIVIILVLLGLVFNNKVKIDFAVMVEVNNFDYCFRYESNIGSRVVAIIGERLWQYLKAENKIFKKRKDALLKMYWEKDNIPKRWWDKCRYFYQVHVLAWRQWCRWSWKKRRLVFRQGWGVAI